MSEVENIEPEAAPVAPSAGLDSILAEFDAATSKPTGLPMQTAEPNGQEGSPAPAEPEAAAADAAPADPFGLLADVSDTYVRDHGFGKNPNPELRDKIGALGNALNEMRAERVMAQNKSDFENVVKRANESLADLDHLAPDFAETWLITESVRNPELRAAFDNRYSSEQAKRWAERCFSRAMRSLRAAAKAVPDREATENRAALTAWMMRGGDRKEPTPSPPKYGSMTDAEFNAEVARHTG